MAFKEILQETRGRVSLITLHRPEKLNAWTRRMSDELLEAFETANHDSGVGAIVVTGAGRAFCAGADVEQAFGAQLERRLEKQLDEKQPDPDGGDAPEVGPWVAAVRRSKPLIAAVNGVAVGVGITQILPFDLILASREAKVGMFFVRMGLVPELGSSQLLVQRVGFALASEMCLSGRLYKATELEGTGFFNAVVDADELLSEALKRAEEIAANPPASLQMIKELLSENGTEPDLEAVQQRELKALREAYRTPEHREAVQAFLERRPPDFTKLRD